MTDCSIVMPVSVRDWTEYLMSTTAIRTCRASTDAPVWVIINNTPLGTLRDRIENQCFKLGVFVSTLPETEGFNLSRLFNMGTQRSFKTKYIAYCCADVIYFPGWLTTLIDAWERYPDYFAVSTGSFDELNMPCPILPYTDILPTAHPSSGVLVLKRESNYVFDEQFPYWEIDADLTYYMERNGLKGGYCPAARCDHLIEGFKKERDPLARRKLEAKWGLARPKEEQ